jgi:hypothetical protein
VTLYCWLFGAEMFRMEAKRQLKISYESCSYTNCVWPFTYSPFQLKPKHGSFVHRNHAPVTLFRKNIVLGITTKWTFSFSQPGQFFINDVKWMRHFRLPPPCKWDHRCFENLCSVEWLLVADVSKQHNGSILKGKGETDRLLSNLGNYQSTLSNIPERKRPVELIITPWKESFPENPLQIRRQCHVLRIPSRVGPDSRFLPLSFGLKFCAREFENI